MYKYNLNIGVKKSKNIGLGFVFVHIIYTTKYSTSCRILCILREILLEDIYWYKLQHSNKFLFERQFVKLKKLVQLNKRVL